MCGGGCDCVFVRVSLCMCMCEREKKKERESKRTNVLLYIEMSAENVHSFNFVSFK